MTQKEIDLIWYTKCIINKGFRINLEYIYSIRISNEETNFSRVFDSTDDFILWAKQNS